MELELRSPSQPFVSLRDVLPLLIIKLVTENSKMINIPLSVLRPMFALTQEPYSKSRRKITVLGSAHLFRSLLDLGVPFEPRGNYVYLSL